MNKAFALNNDKSWKSLYVNDGKIMLMNKSVKSPEDFMEQYSSGGLLKKKKEYSIASINFLSFEKRDANDLMTKGTEENETFEFTNNADLLTFVEYVSKENNLNPKVRKFTTFESLMNPGIGLGLSVLLGWAIYYMAKELESGAGFEISGRRTFYKRIGLWIAETLGSTGTVVVFSILAAICMFWAYKNLKNPGEQIEYSID